MDRATLRKIEIINRRCLALGMPRFAEVSEPILCGDRFSYVVWINQYPSTYIVGQKQFRFLTPPATGSTQKELMKINHHRVQILQGVAISLHSNGNGPEDDYGVPKEKRDELLTLINQLRMLTNGHKSFYHINLDKHDVRYEPVSHDEFIARPAPKDPAKGIK